MHARGDGAEVDATDQVAVGVNQDLTGDLQRLARTGEVEVVRRGGAHRAGSVIRLPCSAPRSGHGLLAIFQGLLTSSVFDLGRDVSRRPTRLEYDCIAYGIHAPPFTCCVWPVTYAASSLHRNSAVGSISSGCAIRPRGI